MYHFIPDEYEVVRTIYQDSDTLVCVVRSLKRQQTLVAKCTSKASAVCSDIYFEANLLQGLQHPGIPTICDVYEDDTSFVLFEEYVVGDSLDRYLLHHQQLTRDNFLNIAIQLCDILVYLHSHGPQPILYLDMKPSHIIIQGGRVKLIDYGIATFLPESGKFFQNFGTKAYAAPEQLSGQPLGEYTDVYGVGKVLAHMLGFLSKDQARGLRRIIRRATVKNPYRRTQSMALLRAQLERQQKSRHIKQRDQEHLTASIAVVGADRGVGCTHFAIALVTYLNQAGFTAYYRNRTEQRVLETMEKQGRCPVDKDGFIYHESFRGTLGGGLEGNTNSLLGIQVLDCGTNPEGAESDVSIYICGGRIWQQTSIKSWCLREEDLLVANLCSQDQAKELARKYDKKVYLFPYQKNPFVTATAQRRVLDTMIRYLFLT